MSYVDVSEAVELGLPEECDVAVVPSIFGNVMGVVGLARNVDVADDLSPVVGVAGHSMHAPSASILEGERKRRNE